MLVCLRRGMRRLSNGQSICWILVIGFLISTLPLSTTVIQSTSAELPNHIVISEILVSPNNEDYNGTDWNGDGITNDVVNVADNNIIADAEDYDESFNKC